MDVVGLVGMGLALSCSLYISSYFHRTLSPVQLVLPNHYNFSILPSATICANVASTLGLIAYGIGLGLQNFVTASGRSVNLVVIPSNLPRPGLKTVSVYFSAILLGQKIH